MDNTYDIYLSPVSGEKPFGFYYKQAARVTGNTKMAQLFLRCLLTPEGTDLTGNITGTPLPDILGGNVPDYEYVRTVAALCVQTALENARGLLRASGSTTNIETATVTDVQTDAAGNADIYVKLMSTDGTALEITLPGYRDNAAAVDLEVATYGSLLTGL